jgi:hypothetical protein
VVCFFLSPVGGSCSPKTASPYGHNESAPCYKQAYYSHGIYFNPEEGRALIAGV